MRKELAYRDNDGIAVTLFWHPASNRLTVSVNDTRNGDGFELAADPAEALDAFRHPYAYAAQRTTTRVVVREALAA